jgi:hypothetical protein
MANNLKELDVDELLNVSESSGGVSIHIKKVSTGEQRQLKMVDQGGINEIEYDYDGPYEVTPNQTTQTLPTENKTLLHDITIKPIPSNYGLITWNGSTLTVS